jgi:hypothetical protein
MVGEQNVLDKSIPTSSANLRKELYSFEEQVSVTRKMRQSK